MWWSGYLLQLLLHVALRMLSFSGLLVGEGSECTHLCILPVNCAAYPFSRELRGPGWRVPAVIYSVDRRLAVSVSTPCDFNAVDSSIQVLCPQEANKA